MLNEKSSQAAAVKAATTATSKTILRSDREVISVDVLQQLNQNLQVLEDLNSRLNFMLSELQSLTRRFER